MPELPEVETVRKGLEQKLKNFIIKRVEICRESTVAYPIDKQDFVKGLQNSLINKWDRRGKYLIAKLKKADRNHTYIENEMSLKNNGSLVVHLRMTGYFTFNKNPTSPCKHTRIRLFDNNNNELRYIDVRSFGQMWWVREGLSPKNIIKGLGALGPEPFSEKFNISYLTKIILNKTRSIKSILLDQTIVAGIGNIYADESLYSAGISPFREARTIEKHELIKLRIAIIEVLKKSIGAGGTTFSDFRDLEGENGNFGLQTNVYRRTGKKCHACKNLIERQKISGRSTHWCRKCQK
ncbi:Formamidopyrimidine-DNA glycolase (FAPY-DNA glycolase) [Prochlorococcus marinus str. MIT 9515]|uniref:Formamidopyrimidine-DNA glycosylase n=1 Tax=Prochlorococcus marinus (strain MIT 9515) TaxID=167542 RepID=FPG_PROM5|nr:DNA-formamidopyrimidine glycosylase [Prochlorococcus marinus]A2BUV8.1 RecName: Full=Formamidopyrimidine-DNA glycosylase; Short=Fapy-DNA glycosylase; AltName: Full=DNA-(apurinic or apyrimidinic site) lyase MutM; Short=AP lyase MutM [Prochlorococcus marinus str. MIT 9515]ABM71569.1 Formamidopyrimidine-DNA glycolase (FAPY-DNA glycolase) [Prochlorococcus marinus str. MIT 9515]